MILICPHCAKRYRLAPGAIGVAGRQVRCHSCGHTWLALPDQTIPPPAGPPDEPDPDTETAPPPVPPPLPPRAPTTAPAGSHLPALLAWLAVALLVGLLGVAWFGRSWLVGLAPDVARYYRGLGIEVAVAPGLEIRAQSSERVAEGERELLVVRGEVHNPADIPRDVPPVRVSLLDGRGNEAAFALVNAEPGRLEPGAAAAFEVRIPEPPAAAESYRVTLEER